MGGHDLIGAAHAGDGLVLLAAAPGPVGMAVLLVQEGVFPVVVGVAADHVLDLDPDGVPGGQIGRVGEFVEIQLHRVGRRRHVPVGIQVISGQGQRHEVGRDRMPFVPPGEGEVLVLGFLLEGAVAHDPEAAGRLDPDVDRVGLVLGIVLARPPGARAEGLAHGPDHRLRGGGRCGQVLGEGEDARVPRMAGVCDCDPEGLIGFVEPSQGDVEDVGGVPEGNDAVAGSGVDRGRRHRQAVAQVELDGVDRPGRDRSVDRDRAGNALLGWDQGEVQVVVARIPRRLIRGRLLQLVLNAQLVLEVCVVRDLGPGAAQGSVHGTVGSGPGRGGDPRIRPEDGRGGEPRLRLDGGRDRRRRRIPVPRRGVRRVDHDRNEDRDHRQGQDKGNDPQTGGFRHHQFLLRERAWGKLRTPRPAGARLPQVEHQGTAVERQALQQEGRVRADPFRRSPRHRTTIGMHRWCRSNRTDPLAAPGIVAGYPSAVRSVAFQPPSRGVP